MKPSSPSLVVMIFGLATALIACITRPAHAQEAPRAPRPDYTWSDNTQDRYLDTVRFANGDLAQVAQGELAGYALKGMCDISRLELRRGRTGELIGVTSACDSHVYVVAAYPSATQAKVAIAVTNCGGTACHNYNDYHVLYLAQGAVRAVRVGTGFYGPRGKPMVFSFSFKGDDLARSTLSPFYSGERNALGDLLPSTRQWDSASGEYLDARFRPAWRAFLGEHPEALLADKTARAPIVKKVKPEQFRAFRAAMSGPGASTLVEGRYLVMNACMKSNCPYEFGAVVVDGFTGDLQVMTFSPEDRRHVHVGTRPLNPRTDTLWLDAVDTQDVLRLSIQAGALKVEPVARK
ncbi:MAG: hypothetical protein ACOVK6_13465 [Ramlibacter sp.]|jgi:hypothetical protein